jgi:hypothetical protein
MSSLVVKSRRVAWLCEHALGPDVDEKGYVGTRNGDAGLERLTIGSGTRTSRGGFVGCSASTEAGLPRQLVLREHLTGQCANQAIIALETGTGGEKRGRAPETRTQLDSQASGLSTVD